MQARNERSGSVVQRGLANLVLGGCAAAMLWLPLPAAGDIGFGDVTASDYAKKMKITFAGYNHNPPMDTLTNFPALAVFSNNVDGSGFTYDDFVGTDGYDLTFTSDDGTTIIPHEVDGTWADGGTNWVWVRVPELVDTNTFIWAYWGKSGAARPAYTTNGAVWVDYGMVLHFGNATTLNVNDSSPYRKTYTVNGVVTPAAGKVRGGADFNGSTGWIDLGANATHLIASNKTITTWAINKGSNKVAYWYDRGQNADEWGQDGVVWVPSSLYIVQPGGGQVAFAYSTLASGDYLAFTWQGKNVHCDRNAGQNTSDVVLAIVPTNQPSYRSAIGRAGDLNNYYFDGTLDEFRIARVAHSADWVWAEYTSMGDPMGFNAYGNMEDNQSPDLPAIQTQAPTGVTTETATLVGNLTSTGTASQAWVGVFWGDNDGGNVTNDTDGVWDRTNWFPTAFTTLGAISTNMPLDGATLGYGDRWYRFAVTNDFGGWGQGASQYFINTNVWITGPASIAEGWGWSTYGTVTVHRAATATGGAFSVTFTTNATHTTRAADKFSLDPASQVTFAAGETNREIVVTIVPEDGAVNDTIQLDLVASANNRFVIGEPSTAQVEVVETPLPTGWGAATGGVVTNYTDAGGTNWTAHIFTNTVGTSNLNVTVAGIFEVLVVGGGGGGGSTCGGGAGGGAVVSIPSAPVDSGTYTVTVGDGGGGGTSQGAGATGSASSITFGISPYITAIGGGGGGGYNTLAQGKDGGSGGGEGAPSQGDTGKTAGNALLGSSSLGGFTGTIYGNNGGQITGGKDSTTSRTSGGGGGGAGTAGSGGSGDSTTPFNGGNGIAIDILGTSYYWGGGGAGGSYQISGGAGGLGGGGGGGGTGASPVGAGDTAGTGHGLNAAGNGSNTGTLGGPGGAGGANTGGGGGGGSYNEAGGKGGSGIVIVRYETFQPPRGTLFILR